MLIYIKLIFIWDRFTYQVRNIMERQIFKLNSLIR